LCQILRSDFHSLAGVRILELILVPSAVSTTAISFLLEPLSSPPVNHPKAMRLCALSKIGSFTSIPARFALPAAGFHTRHRRSAFWSCKHTSLRLIFLFVPVPVPRLSLPPGLAGPARLLPCFRFLPSVSVVESPLARAWLSVVLHEFWPPLLCSPWCPYRSSIVCRSYF
jgi:hypothetical protein